MDFPAELYKLGNGALARRAVEPVVALVCLSFTATFVELADKLGDAHTLLYGLCVLLTLSTGAIGMGGRSLHLYRVFWRTEEAGGEAASD
jgi:hypothetical protein